MIQLKDAQAVIKTVHASKYPIAMGVQIEWPFQVEHKGQTYYWYDKTATENKTGLPCACYKLGDETTDQRLWLRCDGEITED